FGMVVLAPGFIGRCAAQRAGHAQVDDLRTVIEIDQKVLAAAVAAAYLPAADFVGQIGGNGPAHPRLVNHEALEHMVGHNRRYSATGRFDFWQFRHEGVITSLNLTVKFCHLTLIPGAAAMVLLNETFDSPA